MTEPQMPESIIVPTFDPNYDLVTLLPMQVWLLPYEIWWRLFLWALFAATLSYVIYHFILAPYLKHDSS